MKSSKKQFLSKQKTIKTLNSSKQQAAKQKLIQYSEEYFSRDDSRDKIKSFFDTKKQQISRLNKTQDSYRSPQNHITFLPKTKISTQFKRQCVHLKDITKIQCKSTKNNLSQSRDKQLFRQPISLSNYLVIGSSSVGRTHKSAPKSQYIIRQRRNSKKLKRIQQKRQNEQQKTKNSILDKLISEKQSQKIIKLKTMMLENKYRNHQLIAYLQQINLNEQLN